MPGDGVDAEAESAASAGGGIDGTVLVGQAWWSASLMEEYCRGPGGALTLVAVDVSLDSVSATGRGCDLRMLCSSIVGSKSIVVC